MDKLKQDGRMPFAPLTPPRCAVVDLGSNSVRLVIYEGQTRIPKAIFNEKAVLRLGQGMQGTGYLNTDAMDRALAVMRRYYHIARAMGANPLEVLATAAVREAKNGPGFVAALRRILPDVSIKVLSGTEEAAYSTTGLLCGIPEADGVLADIGGGSLEVIRLINGTHGLSQSRKLGTIRLAEQSGGDRSRALAIAESELSTVPWLAEAADRDLYLVGGAWRALARVHMAQANYPLNIVHRYTISRDAAQSLAIQLSTATSKALERLPGAARRRAEDLPFAGIVLRQLLRQTRASRVVFSASGLREGWFMERMPPEIQGQDPLLSGAQEMSSQYGRDPSLPGALTDWTKPLFPRETPKSAKLRQAVCWISDIGSHDHPEFRAEQAFLRVLHHPGVGMDHEARAFLALAVAFRYEATDDAAFLRPARTMLDNDTANRAEVLGMALRLAYTLSAGTAALLAATRVWVDGTTLVLGLKENEGVFADESVLRRLERLAHALHLRPNTQTQKATVVK